MLDALLSFAISGQEAKDIIFSERTLDLALEYPCDPKLIVEIFDGMGAKKATELLLNSGDELWKKAGNKDNELYFGIDRRSKEYKKIYNKDFEYAQPRIRELVYKYATNCLGISVEDSIKLLEKFAPDLMQDDKFTDALRYFNPAMRNKHHYSS